MHIVYIIHQFYPNHYSGTERVVFGTAAYMQKIGHKVTILTYSHEEDETYTHKKDEILYKEYMYEGLNVIAVKSNADYYNSSYFIDSTSDVHEYLIKKINPDIVHVAHFMYMYAFVRAAKKLNIAYVTSLTDFWLICHSAQMITSHGALCSGPQGGKKCREMCLGLESFYYERRFEIAKDILSGSRANIVSSHFLQNTMKSVIENFHSVFIPYGLNFSYLNVNNRVYDRDSKISFLFSGTLSKHKGIDTVISAFKTLDTQNFELNIYGDGPLKSFVVNEVKNIENINFLGSYFKEETKRLIKENDVVLVPSAWYENNPIILQEMLAANVVAIVSNIGSLPEMISDKKSGFVFEMSNVGELQKIISGIIEDPIQLNDIKANMYKDYKVITIEQQVFAYLDIYKNIINGV